MTVSQLPLHPPIFKTQEGELKSFVVLLLPGFSNLVLGSVTAPVMAANSILGEDHYCFRYVSFERNSVISEAGCCMKVEDISTVDQAFGLIVCGGSPVSFQYSPSLSGWLQHNAYRFKVIIGVATGSLMMAEAGLLANHRAVVHWWDDAYLFKQFSNVRLVQESFVVDRQRATCRGGTSAMDMMSVLLAREHGPELAKSLAQHFIRARVGGTTRTHRKLLTKDQIKEQPRLTEAVALMESNIEEPLSTEDIAGHVGISRRQLERLFKKILDSVPSKYYLQIRLEQARSLLFQSELSVMEIALQCGFSSGAHLSTSYRNHFGLTPSDERRAKLRME